MTAIAEKLRNELVSLSASERGELAHFLIRTLDEETGDDSEAAWDAELDRRAAEIQSGSVVGEPAEKVFAELRVKHS
jgi:putative addiction module component (TIGR02574 family)